MRILRMWLIDQINQTSRYIDEQAEDDFDIEWANGKIDAYQDVINYIDNEQSSN